MTIIRRNIYFILAIFITVLFSIGLMFCIYFYSSHLPKIKPEAQSLVQKQIEDLNHLRGDTKPYSQQDLNKQIEALNKLRNQK